MQNGTCSVCGVPKMVYLTKQKVLICRTCRANKRYHDKKFHEECFNCHEVRHVATRIDSKPVCNKCYRHLFMKKEYCQLCGELRFLTTYMKTQLKVCTTCRSRRDLKNTSKFEICVECDTSRHVATRDFYGAAICHRCYFKKRSQNKE